MPFHAKGIPLGKESFGLAYILTIPLVQINCSERTPPHPEGIPSPPHRDALGIGVGGQYKF